MIDEEILEITRPLEPRCSREPLPRESRAHPNDIPGEFFDPHHLPNLLHFPAPSPPKTSDM